MRKKLLLLIFVGLLVFSLSACDNGLVDEIREDSEENNEYIEHEDYEIVEGSIVGGLSSHYLASSANISSQNNGNPHNYIADEIWAFPIITDDYGFADLSFLQYKTIFPIKNNGQFNIELDNLPDFDRFLFVLADSEAEDRRDRIIDFVSIRGNNNLRTIPARGITEGIALGNLNRNNDEAVSSVRLEELRDRFTNHSLEELEIIAATDNALKALKNYYVNYNDETGEEFSFSFSYGGHGYIEEINNNYIDVDLYEWSNPLFHVRTNMGDENPKKLIPPAGSSNSTLDLGISHDGGSYYSYFGTFHEEISEGFWTLKEDNDELGYFDFSFTLDFDDNDVPLTILPSVKLNTEDEIVKSISIKWYINSSEGLTEVRDIDILEELVMGAFVQFDNGITMPVEVGQDITEFDSEVEFRDQIDWEGLHMDNFQKLDYSLFGISFEMSFQAEH